MEFDLEIIQTLITEQGVDWSVSIASAIAVFVVGKWVARRATNIVKKLMTKSKMDNTLVSFLGNVLYSLAFAFVVIAALSQLGVETTSLAAIFAAAGLAIGLSLQSSLSNLAAGVMIIAFRPFAKGDFIEAGGTSGVVEDVTIFTTALKTGDNKQVIVPNGAIISDNITNYSAKDTRRIDFVFGVSYNDDLKKVKQVLAEILEADARVLKEPEPTIAVSELADNSVNLVCRPWVKTADYWGAYFDITEAVKNRFDAEGISIPYPQQDVYMHQASDTSKVAA